MTRVFIYKKVTSSKHFLLHSSILYAYDLLESLPRINLPFHLIYRQKSSVELPLKYTDKRNEYLRTVEGRGGAHTTSA